MKRKSYLLPVLVIGGLFTLSGYAYKGAVSNSSSPSPQALAMSQPLATTEPETATASASAAITDVAALEAPDVQFDFDRASIRPEAHPELQRVAKLMQENNASLKVGGHADNVGEYVYNWHLSKARADAVKAYLVANGADATRIAATEYGDTTPKVPNSTDENRQINRRVEIEFY
ncbi:OmpA family protein [Pontibacter qinzhouensis]|uniref:OmpA family protein n=1 Tax=Pontibacter qinzhouensis TaxID=2603253 RepID=A0A5C8J0J2_9BACT|nr:OmpA family protein [Pontibacter qinzhouensis]TXK26764.1 OmpA family protein [Pontibacter qinzhouensis]